MVKWLITFSGAAYDDQTGRTVRDAPNLGVDRVLVYDDAWVMRHEFYSLPGNRWLWEHRNSGPNGGKYSRPDHKNRGWGWFSWKPLIILDALDRMDDGDIVLYLDGDSYPFRDLSALYEECARNEGFMVFEASGQGNEKWLKHDCAIVMAQDEDRYRFCQHAVARFMLFQKGRWAVRQFLMEWLTYACNRRATTFDVSTIAAEYPELHEHRTEQAIFTLLVHKYGLRLYREACAFGNGYDKDKDLYPQLFVQEWGNGPRNQIGSKFANVG